MCEEECGTARKCLEPGCNKAMTSYGGCELHRQKCPECGTLFDKGCPLTCPGVQRAVARLMNVVTNIATDDPARFAEGALKSAFVDAAKLKRIEAPWHQEGEVPKRGDLVLIDGHIGIVEGWSTKGNETEIAWRPARSFDGYCCLACNQRRMEPNPRDPSSLRCANCGYCTAPREVQRDVGRASDACDVRCPSCGSDQIVLPKKGDDVKRFDCRACGKASTAKDLCDWMAWASDRRNEPWPKLGLTDASMSRRHDETDDELRTRVKELGPVERRALADTPPIAAREPTEGDRLAEFFRTSAHARPRDQSETLRPSTDLMEFFEGLPDAKPGPR